MPSLTEPPSPEDIASGRDRRRLLWLVVAILALLAVLVGHYYRLQILEGDYWQHKAQRQHFFTREEPAQRGLLYGTTAQRSHPSQQVPLVSNVRYEHLYADTLAIPEELHEAVVGWLGQQLTLSTEQIAVVTEQLQRRSRCRSLGIALTPRERQDLELAWGPWARERQAPRHALFCLPGWRRCHPYGALLGQLLHTVQHKSAAVKEPDVPTGGLELTFDSVLKGKNGQRRLMRSPRHTFETGHQLVPPRDGASIQLTIDPYLQAVVEEELVKGIHRSRSQAGWAVMMNPHTGAILALAQYPFFEPDDYSRYFTNAAESEHARLKTIVDAREPGSVVKPLTIALAMLANQQLVTQGLPTLFSPHEKIATLSGYFQGRGRPLQDTQPHRFLNMYMAIRKSSNIYMARLVERMLTSLGAHWYTSQLAEVFGFGTKTGFEMPGESAGFLPRPGSTYANGKPSWSQATPFSLAIGYNLQATSLQLVRAYAVFANGGYLVQPTLLSGAVHKRRVLSPDIIREVIKAMKYVTKTGGSAQRADLFGYTEVGKSSTSKKIIDGVYSETLYTSSFIGFAPVDQPAAFVLLITLDEPAYGFVAGYGKSHNGGSCAGPIFRAIGRRTLAYLGCPQDDPHGFPRGDPRRAQGQPDWTNEADRLQEMYEKWNTDNH